MSDPIVLLSTCREVTKTFRSRETRMAGHARNLLPEALVFSLKGCVFSSIFPPKRHLGAGTRDLCQLRSELGLRCSGGVFTDLREIGAAIMEGLLLLHASNGRGGLRDQGRGPGACLQKGAGQLLSHLEL